MFLFMKIFDCFTFFNEEEILKIRLNTLNDYVDYFVVIEGSKTFTGNPKPFYFDDYAWIKPFVNKIIKIRIDFPECLTTSWDFEFFQRNQILNVKSYAKSNDIIIISDVDEIINPNIFNIIKKVNKPVQLDNYQYFWNFNWRAPQHCNQGGRPVACKLKHLLKSSPQNLRASSELERIPNGGWHFSFCLDKKDIVKKIESFAHTEYNKEEYKNLKKIIYRMENGIDPFDRFPLKYYDIDETYPKYVQRYYD